MRRRPVRPLPARPAAAVPRRPGAQLRPRPNPCSPSGSCDDCTSQPAASLAVWKFASCDGCQLTLLDCEDELLALASRVRFASLHRGVQRGRCPGRTTCPWSRGRSPPPTTRSGSARSASSPGSWSPSAPAPPRAASRRCGTSPTCTEFRAVVYASPQYIDTLATSTPISAHVPVDFELRGCPIDKGQLLELITALLAGRKPDIPDASVCTECKRRGLTCVHGRGRHALPGPGHPRRLRGAVPGRAARLLRLLRAGDRRQRAGPDPASARAAGCRRARSTWSCPPSTPRRRRSRRPARREAPGDAP